MYSTHKKNVKTHEFREKLFILAISTMLILAMIFIFGELVEAKGNIPNTQVHVHDKNELAKSITVNFEDSERDIILEKPSVNSKNWKGPDNKEYVTDDIVALTINGIRIPKEETGRIGTYVKKLNRR